MLFYLLSTYILLQWKPPKGRTVSVPLLTNSILRMGILVPVNLKIKFVVYSASSCFLLCDDFEPFCCFNSNLFNFTLNWNKRPAELEEIIFRFRLNGKISHREKWLQKPHKSSENWNDPKLNYCWGIKFTVHPYIKRQTSYIHRVESFVPHCNSTIESTILIQTQL